MKDNLARRIAKLESDEARTGMRYSVSSDMLTHEEWQARLGEDIMLVTDERDGDPVLTEAEWEAAHVVLSGLHHWSDCPVFNEPALPASKCDCGGFTPGK